MTKTLIITGFGINCEEEMAAAYRLAGATPTIVHLNELLHEKVSIHDYDLLNFVGGFSFGDDIASGKVMANKIRFKKLPSQKTLLAEIHEFIKNGKYILGVCNGFQILVKMGLLPNLNQNFEQEVSLIKNDSQKFENRWVYCKANSESKTPFLKNIEILPLPVRHGEGKLVIKDETTTQAIQAAQLNCLSYCNEKGELVMTYPENPNGSALACAGLCDTTGQIFGLMPHPEAFLSLYNHPNWGKIKRQNPNISEEGAGLKIFRNIVTHIQEQKEQQPQNI